MDIHPLTNIHLASAIPELRLCCRTKKKERQTEQEPLIAHGLQNETETEESKIERPSFDTNYYNKSTNDRESALTKRSSFKTFLKKKFRLDEDNRGTSRDFDDPFIIYGYGVVAFFDLLKVLIVLFAFISLTQWHIIYRYYTYSDTIPSHYGVIKGTLANLG